MKIYKNGDGYSLMYDEFVSFWFDSFEGDGVFVSLANGVKHAGTLYHEKAAEFLEAWEAYYEI
tara:strand:- start:17831 stop:18019 length:189 start_codon:yes stop_codon:yes gene_type:complete